MISIIQRWFGRKWQRQSLDMEMAKAYQVTFASPDGQRVLQHLMDEIYCTVYEGTNPVDALVHNARRSVVDEILRNIHYAESPEFYKAKESVSDIDLEAQLTARG